MKRREPHRRSSSFGAGEGNRTPVFSLGSWHSAIELHPQAVCIIAGSAEKCKYFFHLDEQNTVSKKFHKNLFTKKAFIAIIYNKITEEVMMMKVLFSMPVDIDELIFAGETTVPSDRWARRNFKGLRFNSSRLGRFYFSSKKRCRLFRRHLFLATWFTVSVPAPWNEADRETGW